MFDETLLKYTDELKRLNIKFVPLDKEAPTDARAHGYAQITLNGNIMEMRLPFLSREKFLLLVDEIKNFGMQFNKSSELWWIFVRDKATLNNILSGTILNEVGYKIDKIAQKTLVERIEDSADTEKELLKLSSAATTEIDKIKGFNGTLYPFQKVTIEYSEKNNTIFIADEMGLGKTVQALAIIEKHNLFPALVVSPGHLKKNWISEAKKFLPSRTTYILETGKKIQKADIYIISYGSVETFGEGLKVPPFKSIVLDESHYIKNHRANRTKSVQKYLKHIPFKMMLTGTPILNRPLELVSQLNFLGTLKTHFGGKWKFIQRYAPPTSNGLYTEYGADNLEELQLELRKSCMVRRMKADVLKELPEKQKQVVFLELSDYTAYREVERDSIKWYETQLKKSGDLSQFEIKKKVLEKRINQNPLAEKLVKINYLKQAATEYKLLSVYKWINDVLSQTDKLLVFAHHKFVINALAEKYKKISVVLNEETSDKAKELETQFQTDPDIKLFIGSLMIASVGLTLTAANKVAFVELGWNPSIHQQAEDRVHRIGQTMPVNIYYLLGEDTVDEYIYDIIIQKGEIIDKATNVDKIFEQILRKNI